MTFRFFSGSGGNAQVSLAMKRQNYQKSNESLSHNLGHNDSLVSGCHRMLSNSPAI